MNYYAVKEGREKGVFSTWDECKKNVIGHKGAIYKKFSNYEDAIKFIEESNDKEKLEKIDDNEVISYVDGSYDINDGSFSYGVLIFDDNGLYETYSKRFYDDNRASMRNVAGEICGSMFSMKKAIELGKKVLYLHYDYKGIESWATGEWKTNKEGTIEYKKFYDSIKNDLVVKFIKVKAHSGIKYNELVDKLAKEAK